MTEPDWIEAAIRYAVDDATGAARPPGVLLISDDADVLDAALATASQVLAESGMKVLAVDGEDPDVELAASLHGSRTALIVARADLAPDWVTGFGGFMSCARSRRNVTIGASTTAGLADAQDFAHYCSAHIRLDNVGN